MTMRATVQRNGAGGKNAWNRPEKPELVEVGVFPCRVWVKQRRDVQDDSKDAVLGDLRGIFPVSADVQEEDRLVDVRDRLGNLLWAGPLYVETIEQTVGSGSPTNHRTAQLRRHTR